jgi:hypothetical protein
MLMAPVIIDGGPSCSRASLDFRERTFMTVSFADLNTLGFSASNKIVLDADGAPRFVALTGASMASAPAVYLWLKHAAGEDVGEVLYVGKAGKGVARRCAQHQGGFTNSGTGRKNAAALSGILADNAISVTVMARTSETVTLFGKTVSMYATEEDALCGRFGPRLNRAAFPEVTGGEEATPDVVEKPASEIKQAPQPGVAKALLAEGDGSRIVALINSRLRVQDEGTVDDMIGQVEAYGPQDLARLEGLLELIEARLLAPDHALKLIGGYGDQPKGCNGITTLGFGRLVERNFAPNGWVARIYLTDSPRVSFPLRMLNAAGRDQVEANNNLFSPLDVDAFLRNPGAFLAPGHLR